MTVTKSMAGAMKQYSKNPIPEPIEYTFDELYDHTAAEIRRACAELADTLVKKNQDYGRGNIAEFGWLGVLVRASDKVSRLKTLSGALMPNYEAIEDTWKDLAGYAIIGMLINQGKW